MPETDKILLNTCTPRSALTSNANALVKRERRKTLDRKTIMGEVLNERREELLTVQDCGSGWRSIGSGWRLSGSGWILAGSGWRLTGSCWILTGSGWRIFGSG